MKDLSINAVFNFYARRDLNVLLDGTNMPISLPITISSNVEQDIYCKIKQVFIQWDCLGEETLILMERNGSRKNNVIRIGDVVDTGRILTKVVYIYIRETILQIVAETGKRLRLTGRHPILTEQD